jgi:hypothetical protein
MSHVSARKTSLVLTAARVGGVLGLCIGVTLLARFSFDDAYIHMRIARHLAFDGVPYFNVHERVMGGSSPLWLLLVSGLFRVAGSPEPLLVVALECAVVSGLWLAVDLWLADVSGRRSWLTSALAFAMAYGLVLPTAGFLMEPPLAALLGVLGLLALNRGHQFLAGVAIALASATRYELAVLGVVAWLLTPGVRPRLRMALGVAPVLVAEVGLLLHWYGTLVPNTVRAKAIAYPISFAQFFDTVPSLPGLHAFSALTWAVGSAACAVGALGALWRDSPAGANARRSVAIAGGFAACLLVLYTVKRTSMFQWYWLNVVMPSALAGTATALRVGQLHASGGDWRRHAAAIVGVLGVALATLPTAARSANTLLAAAISRPSKSATLFASLRIRTYFAVGEELYRKCPTGTLLTSEIGAIGWSFRGRLVDGLGLVSPEALKYHPMRVPEQRSSETVGAVPAQAAAELRPDFVVGMEIFLEEFLRRHAAGDPTLQDYELTDERPVTIVDGQAQPLWGSNHVLTFTRKGACDRR